MAGAVQIGRMSAQKAFRSVQETNFVAFRIWCTTHSCRICMRVDGFDRIWKPFQPVAAQDEDVFDALRSLNTLSQKRAPSDSSIHKPRTSCRPSTFIPGTICTHFLTKLLLGSPTRTLIAPLVALPAEHLCLALKPSENLLDRRWQEPLNSQFSAGFRASPGKP